MFCTEHRQPSDIRKGVLKNAYFYISEEMDIPTNVSKASMFPPPEEREEGCSTMTVPETYCEEKIEAQVLGGLQPMDGGPYGVSFFAKKNQVYFLIF